MEGRKAGIKATVMDFIDGKTTFQLQYQDYSLDEWTVPVLLTEERAAKFLDDMSVKTIKIICNNELFFLVP